MRNLIAPIPREDLLRELTPERKIRDTKKASNEIYIFEATTCPSLMREVGRLREEAFRAAGGGTGKEVDIDWEDLDPSGYSQLIVWDPSAQEIVGGYRFNVCQSEHPECLSTEHYFRFSDRFRKKFLPHTIELGRSFVQVQYQARRNPKSLYALDNLWDGLGALVVLNPKAHYLFGKVTMYPSYNREARAILFHFLNRYFGDKEALMEGLHPLPPYEGKVADNLFPEANYEENYRLLIQHLRERNELIPPLINLYMNLSPTMRLFDTVINADFGQVEETAILITIKDIYPEKKLRYIRWEGWRKNLRARREAFASRKASIKSAKELF